MASNIEEKIVSKLEEQVDVVDSYDYWNNKGKHLIAYLMIQSGTSRS